MNPMECLRLLLGLFIRLFVLVQEAAVEILLAPLEAVVAAVAVS